MIKKQDLPKRVVGVIPARYHSKRLPGKPLALLNGYPLVYHVYIRAMQAKLDDLVIATDEEKVIEILSSLGCKVKLTSPNHLSGTDRVAEVARIIPANVYINIQGDEPLISPVLINDIRESLLTEPEIGIVTARKKLTLQEEINNPNVVKVVVDKNSRALYFSRAVIPALAQHFNNIAKVQHYKHIGIYGYQKETLFTLTSLPASSLELSESLEQLRALENGIAIKVIETDYDSIGVDTAEDLAEVDKILKAKGVNNA